MTAGVVYRSCVTGLAVCLVAGCARPVALEMIPLVSAEGRVADVPARRLSCQPAVYPLAMRELGADGRATLDFVIDTIGSVDSTTIRIVAADYPDFARAARRALQTCRFVPAQAAGRPVRMRARSIFTFTFAP
jgi:TonB family protein